VSKRLVPAVILAAGCVSLLTAYGVLWRGIARNGELEADYAAQRDLLGTVASDQQSDSDVLATRQAQLDSLVGQLGAAEIVVPSAIDSTEVLAEFVTTARAYDVSLRRIEAHQPTTATIAGIDYRVLQYDTTATGVLPAVTAYLAALEAGPISTLGLISAQLQLCPTPIPESTPAITTTLGIDEPAIYDADLSIRIYARLAPTTPAMPGTPIPLKIRAEQTLELLSAAYETEDWERAISLLLVVQQLQPDDTTLDAQLADVYAKAGQQRLAAGQLAPAGSHFRAALGIDPDHTTAQAGLTQLVGMPPTPLPTATATATPTPTALPTQIPTVTPTPDPFYALTLRVSENTRYPGLGCSWFGFAGRVTDAANYPIEGVAIRIWTDNFTGLVTTSSTSGEWEQFVDNHPHSDSWYLQLFIDGQPVSQAITVGTRDDCGSALVTVDWRRGY
jgi:hypothetical protein